MLKEKKKKKKEDKNVFLYGFAATGCLTETCGIHLGYNGTICQIAVPVS